MNIDDKTFNLIKDLSNTFGPSGFEDDVTKLAKNWIEDSAPEAASYIVEDKLRNLYVFRKGNSEERAAGFGKVYTDSLENHSDTDGQRPVLMLDAHSDEVGLMVQSIRPNGLMEFITLGSWSPANFPSSKVWIRAEDGRLVSGIVANKPPHFQTAADRNKPLSVEDMVIDIGATSAQEVREKFHIEVGCPACPAVEFEYCEENHVALGKAFDDRIGCAVVLESLRRLQGEKLAVDVIATLTSQEEVGERGCIAAVKKVNPDIAICVEGAPADDTFMPEYNIQNGMHRGPMMRCMDVCMITHPRFIRYAFKVADELGIPTQRAVRRGGGTNGGAIHTYGDIPCIVISCPVRYPHSHHSYTALDDFEKTVQLVCELLRRLDQETVGTF